MVKCQFHCPECDQVIEVNGPVREAIIANGCPVCTATVDTTHFAPS